MLHFVTQAKTTTTTTFSTTATSTLRQTGVKLYREFTRGILVSLSLLLFGDFKHNVQKTIDIILEKNATQELCKKSSVYQ